MEVNDRIKKLRIAKGMTQDELARKVGYSGRSTICRIENGEVDINQSMILKYAYALDVSPAYLIFGDETGMPKNLNEPRKAKFRPLLGVIACGDPILADENIETYIPVPQDIRCDFVLTCKGNSMIDAGIYNGDYVYLRKQDMVDNGEIAAVLIANSETEATLKRIYIDAERITLMPCNSTMPPMIYAGEQAANVRILGKAVAVTHKL